MSVSRDSQLNVLAHMPIADLRETRAKAATKGDLTTSQLCHDAMTLRTKIQTPEIERCGQLFEHVEREMANNVPTGRFIARYTGDPNCWMKHFQAPGISGRFNHAMRQAALRTEAKERDEAAYGKFVTGRQQPDGSVVWNDGTKGKR